MTALILVALVVYGAVLIFMLALCAAAARGDRAMERERWR